MRSHVKVLERNPVIRIGAFERRLEHEEVVPRYEPTPILVGDAEEDGPLGASNLKVALRRNCADERIRVKVPAGASRPGCSQLRHLTRRKITRHRERTCCRQFPSRASRTSDANA
jgi:hypothetical protein